MPAGTAVKFQSVVHKLKKRGKLPKSNFPYGANEDNSATGIGGRDRRNKIDSIVEGAVKGKRKRK